MTRIIAFSLWGNNPKYIIGAIKNAILAQQIYPDWVCRFYLDKISYADPNIKYLKILNNVQIVYIDIVADWTFNIYRFYPLIENIEYMISRDCDSRISIREKMAVDQWIASNKTFHIMKDHPFQFNYPILAGMFGSKSLPIDSSVFNNIIHQGHFSDQIFLQKYIWPLIQTDYFIHDGINNIGLDFPTKRNNQEFVGEIFDANDNRHPEHYRYITS